MNTKIIRMITVFLILLLTLMGCTNQNKIDTLEKYNAFIELVDNKKIEEAYGKLKELQEIDNYKRYIDEAKYDNYIFKLNNQISEKIEMKINRIISEIPSVEYYKDETLQRINSILSEIDNINYKNDSDVVIIKEVIKYISEEKLSEAYAELNNLMEYKYSSLADVKEMFGRSIGINPVIETIQSYKPLEFKNTSLSQDEDYIFYKGSLKNNSDYTYYYIKVKTIYYDKSNNILTTDWSYVVSSEGLSPTESKQFEVMTKVNGDVDYGEIEILDYQME